MAGTVHYARSVNLIRDFRYALRTLRSAPGFTSAAVLTLALGIGANTAVYSVVDGVLLHPLPFPEADGLVKLYQQTANGGKESISYPNLLDWQKRNQTFEGMAGMLTELATLKVRDQPEQLAGMRVSSNFLAVLKLQPVIGRMFTEQEDKRGAAPVVLLGEDFWRQRFGADRGIAGRTLTINGRATTVLGVVPSSVRMNRGNRSFVNDYFAPLGQEDDALFYQRDTGYGTEGIGRLKSGVTFRQARADMAKIGDELKAEYQDADAGSWPQLIPYVTDVSGDLHPTVLALVAAVCFVLLIACTNIANLTLARSVTRSQEFAVRMAMGAGRGALVRQILVESAVLSIGAGGLGVLLAAWATDAALAVLPSALPPVVQVGINSRVLIFSLGVSLFAGMLFGLAPAMRAGAVNLHESLKQGGRGAIHGRYRIQRTLIVAEIAMTMVLLVGAGLMMRSLQNLWDTNPGFDPEHLVVFYTGLSGAHAATPKAIYQSFREVNDRLSALPGVEAASVEIGGLPYQGNSTVGFHREGEAKDQFKEANFYAVGPDHFRTMGIALLRGRDFTRQDTADHPLAVIVDEALARKTFPGQDPLGKRLITGLDVKRPAEIVGVVRHVRHGSLDSDEGMQFYFSYMQLPDELLKLATKGIGCVVRSPLDPAALMVSARKALAAFDPDQAVYDERTMSKAISQSLAKRRFSLAVLGAFAATALLLALVGIYGVISYFVNQRSNEIGVRLALGAQRRDVLAGVLTDGGKLGAIGIALGLAGSAVLTRLLRSQLFEVSPLDPATYAASAAALLALAILACYLPARRAVRIDPMAALRCE